MKKTAVLITLFYVFSISSVFGQLTTTGGMTATQYVQNVLLGGGVTVSNVTFTGNPQAISSFTFAPGTGTGGLGFGNGLLMSTGSAVTGTNGPQGPSSGLADDDNNQPGDADLATIAGQNLSNLNDAVVLEFDFIPQSDSVKFRYIFASEEYNFYVNTSFNDIFAFILSGVTTPLPATNIALVPNTTLPVAISNINNGQSSGTASGPCTNCVYYRDNSSGSINVAYNGLTTVLTARHAVICGETYHIKLVIADVADGALDSGVFLEAGSFSSSAPFDITTSGTSVGPIGSSNTLYENCGALNLLFTRPTTSAANADTLVITIDGTASTADYTGLNDTIFFPPGEDTVIVPVFAIDESVVDAGETVHIYYTYTNPCNIVDTIDYTFTILEAPTFTHTLSNDTTICSAQSAPLLSTVTGGVQPYLYNWTNQSGATVSSGANFTAPPSVQTYYYYVTDACRQDTLFDSVHVEVNTFLYLTGSLLVNGSSSDTIMVEGCGSAVLTFTEAGVGAGIGVHTYTVYVTGTVDNAGGSDLGVSIPTVITMNNTTTQTYNLTAIADLIAENASGPGLEYITITIDYNNNPCIPVTGQVVKTLYIKDPSDFSIELPADTSICKGRAIVLKSTPVGGDGTITYSWAPSITATTQNVLVNPAVTTTYTVTATESCSGQTSQDSIKVTVLYNPPVISLLNADTACLADNYEFNVSVANGVGQVTGSWSTGYLNDLQTNGSNNSWIIYNSLYTEQYIYTAVDQCNVKDYDTLSFTVVDCTPIVPNIVTVNGDKINDVFFIKNLEHNPETSVAIFDRWGKKVYSNANYDNKWSPTELHDGVYFYIVEPKKREKLSGYLHVFGK